MTDYLITFLRALETAMPPPTGRLHAIVVARPQDETDGLHVDKLTVVVARELRTVPIYIEPGDFNAPAEHLAEQVVELVHQVEKEPAA